VRNRRLVLVIAIVIAAPIFFATLGGTRDAGLAIGVVLVAIGAVWGLAGTRRAGDGGEG
jgi:hypothetical protein